MRIAGTLLLVFFATAVNAQTVSGSVDLTAEQHDRLTDRMGDINAQRDVPFASLSDFTDWLFETAVLAEIAIQEDRDKDSWAESLWDNANEPAPTSDCATAGLGPSCTRGELACLALVGDPDCGP